MIITIPGFYESLREQARAIPDHVSKEARGKLTQYPKSYEGAQLRRAAKGYDAHPLEDVAYSLEHVLSKVTQLTGSDATWELETLLDSVPPRKQAVVWAGALERLSAAYTKLEHSQHVFTWAAQDFLDSPRIPGMVAATREFNISLIYEVEMSPKAAAANEREGRRLLKATTDYVRRFMR
jgi:hypothetical protein